MYIFALLCVLVVGVSASTVRESNQYVDNSLTRKLPALLKTNKLDPADLPKFVKEFTEKVGLVQVIVKSDYANGNLTGISKVKRDANCTAPRFVGNKVNVTLNCTLSFDFLSITYQGNLKVGVIPAAAMRVRANVTKTTVFIEVSKPVIANQIRINRFEIKTMGTVHPTFTVPIPNAMVQRALTTSFVSQASMQVRTILSVKFRAALTTALSQEVMPKPL